MVKHKDLQKYLPLFTTAFSAIFLIKTLSNFMWIKYMKCALQNYSHDKFIIISKCVIHTHTHTHTIRQYSSCNNLICCQRRGAVENSLCWVILTVASLVAREGKKILRQVMLDSVLPLTCRLNSARLCQEIA